MNPEKEPLPSRQEVYEALDARLSSMKSNNQTPDVITYAGNGEPTIHPDFASIIEDSIMLRNEFFPEAKISVLSNASMIHRKSVRDALLKVDMNILKLDSGFETTIEILNLPQKTFSLLAVAENMKLFKGKFIIQTLFVKGEFEGRIVDNTTPVEVDKWLEIIRDLRPQSVMIYTIERDTPLGKKLRKVPLTTLREIASRVEEMGISASVSG